MAAQFVAALRRSLPVWSGSNLRGDAVGGLVVALLSLPMTIPLGVMALAPLGPGYAGTGVLAGFYASVFAGLVSALTGGSPLQISGPRASVSLIMATSLGIAVNDPAVLALGQGREQGALLVGLLVVMLAGLCQVGFGLARIGRFIRYIPYPVLAGFMNGVAVVIVLGQLPAALGLPVGSHWSGIVASAGRISPLAVVVTLVTVAAAWSAPRLAPRLPPIVMALGVGVAVDLLFRRLWGTDAAGPVVGAVNTVLSTPDVLLPLLSLSREAAGDLLLQQVPLVLVLALVGSLESLLSAAVLDRVVGSRHDGDRELIGQGLGNMVGAMFGGVASTGAPMRGMAAFKAGARTRMAGALHSVFLLVLLLWGTDVLARLPYSVLAGVMLMVARGMLDAWPLALLRRDGRLFGADFLVVVTVAGVTVLFNLAAAVAVGIGFAVLQFVINMSRPIVRRTMDRSMAKSRRIRSPSMERLLLREGHRIGVVELDGPLFFGTAEDLCGEVERLEADNPRVLVLELRRMSHIDLSGARVLARIAREQAAKGCEVFLAGIDPTSPRGEWLSVTGVAAAIPMARWYPSLDRAMEAAEDVLTGDAAGEDGGEIALEEMSIVEGLTPAELATFRKLLVRRSYHRGDLVFRDGAPCDGLYFLVAGHVEVRMPAAPGHEAVRLTTFLPGTILGELALLDGGRRSADAVAVSDAVAYYMPLEAFEKFRVGRPRAATQLLFNMSRALADRLRLTNALLHSAD